MFSYRGRQLNIDKQQMENFEKVTCAPLSEKDMDRWIEIDFGIDPEQDTGKFELLTDEQIIWCAEENMKGESF